MEEMDATAVEGVLTEMGIREPVTSVSVVDEWTGRATLVETGSGDRYRVFHFPDDGARAQKEAAILHRLHRENVAPVMTVIGVDARGEIAGIPSLVVRDTAGLPVFDIAGLSPANQEGLFREYGATIAALSDTSFETFGLISADGESIIDAERRWRDWFLPRLDERRRALEDGAFADQLPAISTMVEHTRADFGPGEEPALVKGSYRFEQLLVDPEADPLIQAIRGFDRAVAGPPEYGYAIAHWAICGRTSRSPSFREAFEAGYRSVAPIPSDPPAERRRTAYRLERLLGEMIGMERALAAGDLSEDEFERRRVTLVRHLDRLCSG